MSSNVSSAIVSSGRCFLEWWWNSSIQELACWRRPFRKRRWQLLWFDHLNPVASVAALENPPFLLLHYIPCDKVFCTFLLFGVLGKLRLARAVAMAIARALLNAGVSFWFCCFILCLKAATLILTSCLLFRWRASCSFFGSSSFLFFVFSRFFFISSRCLALNTSYWPSCFFLSRNRLCLSEMECGILKTIFEMIFGTLF